MSATIAKIKVFSPIPSTSGNTPLLLFSIGLTVPFIIFDFANIGTHEETFQALKVIYYFKSVLPPV